MQNRSTMTKYLGHDLSNLFSIVLVTSLAMFFIALGFSFVRGEFDLFVFTQILVFPLMLGAGILFFNGTVLIKSDRKFLKKAFWYAFGIRIFSVIAIYFILMEFQGHPYLSGYKDEYVYHKMSLYFARNPWAPLGNIRLLGLSENYGFYPYLVGLFYRVLGEHTLAARFLNAFFGAACVIPFYLFVKNLCIGRQTARLSAVLYLFSVNFILFNSLQLKDTFGMLLGFTLLFIGSLIMRTVYPIRAALFSFLYFIINLAFLYIRGQFFFLFAAFYLIFVFKGIFSKKSLLVSRTVLFIFLVAGILFIRQGIVSDISDRLGKFSYDYLEHQFFRYEGFQVSGIMGTLIPVITALLGFILPLPMLTRLPHIELAYSPDVFQTPAFMEMFFMFFIALFALVNIRKIRPPGIRLVFLLSGIYYFSLIVTGYVTYIRQKLLLTSFIIILASFVISEKMLDFKKLVFLCAGGVILTFFYNLMRLFASGVI